MTLLPTTDLLDAYRPVAGAYDELHDGADVRSHWNPVARAVRRLGPSELADRTREARRLLVDDGVTYNVTSGTASTPRQWLLDPLPVVIASEEWAAIEIGLSQRAELLDLILTDLYGSRRLLTARFSRRSSRSAPRSCSTRLGLVGQAGKADGGGLRPP